MSTAHPHSWARPRAAGARRRAAGLRSPARWAPALVLLLAPLGGCGGKNEGAPAESQSVVLYYSADDPYARPIIGAFEQATGIRVLASGDTEATKNTGLVQKLRAERARPRADVFWSSEVFMTIQLADEGVLAPHTSEAVADWPERLHDAGRHWHGFAQRARVVVYNTERVEAGEAPGTMVDLMRPRWKGRVVMARPQFGTTRGHMGALVALWGEDATRAWLGAMQENDIRLVDGNATVVRMVATGEADVGLTDTDDVWAGQREGWPVDLTYVRHDLPAGATAGPLVIPNAVSLVAGGPNPEAGAKLVDFLLSAQVERMLALSDSHNIPIREELAAEFRVYAAPEPAEVDLAEVARSMDAALRLCDEALGG